MSNLQHATIAIDREATRRAGAPRRGRTIMGHTLTRRTGMVALVAALLLGLGALAGAAAGQLRSGDAAAIAPAPVVVAAPYTGPCRSDLAGCVPDETLIPGVPAALPAAWTGTCRVDSAGCELDEAFIPGFAGFREDHRSAGASDLPGFTDFREDHRP